MTDDAQAPDGSGVRGSSARRVCRTCSRIGWGLLSASAGDQNQLQRWARQRQRGLRPW